MAPIGEEQQADGYAAEPRSLYVGAAKSAPQLAQSRDEDV
jgi:hypothetical protein